MGKGKKGALALCQLHKGGVDVFCHIHHLANVDAVQPRGRRAGGFCALPGRRAAGGRRSRTGASFVLRFVRPGGKRGEPPVGKQKGQDPVLFFQKDQNRFCFLRKGNLRKGNCSAHAQNASPTSPRGISFPSAVRVKVSSRVNCTVQKGGVSFPAKESSASSRA